MGQFRALMGKNWILYKRSMCGNIFEIFIPIFFVGFVIMVSELNPPKLITEQSYQTNMQYSTTVEYVTNTNLLRSMCPGGSKIGFVPTGSTLVTKLQAYLTTNFVTNFKDFATETELEEHVRNSDYANLDQICWAIVISQETSGKYNYKLRFNISDGGDMNAGPFTTLPLTLDSSIDLDTYQNTMWGGMVGANHLINDIILGQQSGSITNHLRQFISPAYQQQIISNSIYLNLGQSVATMFLLPLLIIYLRQTSSMLSEKQSKVRETMRIMGMKMRNYYATWFIRFIAVYLVVHSIASAILMYKLTMVPFYIPFILFIMFDVVIIIQNYFIQVFLSRAKLGIVIALLFFALQFIVSFLVSGSDITENLKMLMSIVPHVAFIFSFQNLLYFQTAQMSASFTATVNNYNLTYALISFAGNIGVFLILLWYFDQVIPSEWGAKRHPLFCCFQKQFQRPQQQRSKGKSKNVFEQVDNSFKAMERTNDIIEIQGLKKQFNGGDLIAVDNLNLKMYKNQIFVLLGHNGAGKTTTISMLTGLIQPTDGFISVFGQTEMDNIRKTLGLCPQHDTLYQDLTVQQHLQLFSTFKGLQGEQKQKQVSKLIRDVNLMQKRDQYSKNLSGGQKRRLSVAISFAGKSKVIILDQPTSGMDTSARRYIWDLLKTYKNDRIIILTTHFMDQADFLGDRIGIMGSGELLCCGSSIFLKNRFGIGYNLTLVKQNSQVDSIAIIKKIQSVIPSSVVLSDVSAQLSMQLPLAQTKLFSRLFHDIQARKSDLRIAQYGISITTLQQVFLRVAQQNEQNQRQILRYKSKYEEASSIQLISYPTSPQKLSKVHSQRPLQQKKLFGSKSIKRLQAQKQQEIPRYSNNCVRFDLHFKATFIKRFRIIKRDVKSFLFQLLLPIAIIICAMLLMKVSFVKDQPEQVINLSTYLKEQNPVLVPIGSSNAAILTSLKNALNTNYLTKISVKDTSAHATAADFDKLFLNPFKKTQKTLKGGIYVHPSTVQAPNTIYPFNSFCVTRGPTSPFFLQTLAAQTIINSQFGKSIFITVSNHPLPLTYSQKSIGGAISGFLGAFVFTLGLAFKFASIVSFIVKQRQDRVKHQQIVSGMKLSAYWIANFIYDYLLYLVIAVAAIVFCKVFEVGSLSSGTAFTSTSMLFFFYGLAYIPFTYIAAFTYKEYGSAQSYYFFITFLMGGMLPVLTFVFRLIGTSSSKIGRYIAWGLRILPAFSFGEGIINLGSIDIYKNNENNGVAMDPFALQISLAPILYLLGQFILYFILLFVIQGIFNSEKMMRCCSKQGSILDTAPSADSDVQQQYSKANKAKISDYQIVTKHLRKVYMVDGRKNYKVAVDDLSFRIRRGQVFGLLGVNGAGKSTTFKMLSGQITSTSGDSYFCGLKISENLDKIRESLGYCPQFDALVETLTVRQQIQLYYDLKSLDSQFKDRLVSQKIKQLDLEKYSDKLSGTLSGGNKRKLSVAIAMIGNPKIIFLDEPSTGMDPKARRFMWKVISKIATQKKQSTIILTTHSMQQAQGLSTRLAIMVKGNFQCIGTPQYIKNKYGEGMELEIKLMHVDIRRIEEVISKKKLERARIVTKSSYEEVLQVLQATVDDKSQISETGRASHIYQMLAREGKVPLELIVQYLEISFISKKLLQELSQSFGEIESLETLQTFLRIKVKRKPNVGKLFDFFQGRKDHYGIQQYTIKQASVQQIFNTFAEGAQASQAGIS